MNDLEAKQPPLLLFPTRSNTELGAEAVRVEGDEVVFQHILKRVTESMLTSYPRSLLGKWTPNRAAIRYPAAEALQQGITRFDSGEALDLDALRALSD